MKGMIIGLEINTEDKHLTKEILYSFLIEESTKKEEI